MKLMHQKAAGGGRRHPKSFSKIAGTALLAAIAAAPMAFPKHAAAQEAKPLQSTLFAGTDTVKQGKPVSFCWGGNLSLDLYNTSLIREMDNVPLAVRSATVDRYYVYEVDPTLKMSPGFCMSLDFMAGASFFNRRAVAELGLGVFWNQESGHVDDEDEGGPGWHTYLYNDLNPISPLMPYVFAEVNVIPLRLALGFQAYAQKYAVEKGWWVPTGQPGGKEVTIATYDLTTIIAGTPYVSVRILGDLDVPSLCLYAGTSFVMWNKPGALGKEADVVFHPAFAIGLRSSMISWPSPPEPKKWSSDW